MAKETYHHGDLRRALLDAAAAAIAESGPAALSLRDLARRAGVSHAAPTHHFGDKKGLLTALATEGFQGLAAALTQTRAATGSFLELGVAYVRYSISHPAHFVVMWHPDLFHASDAELMVAQELASGALYAGVVDLPDSKTSPGSDSVREAGLAAWSIAHGFATLWLSGSLPQTAETPDEAARAVLCQLLR